MAIFVISDVIHWIIKICNLIWILLDYFKLAEKIATYTKNWTQTQNFFLFKHLKIFSMQVQRLQLVISTLVFVWIDIDIDNYRHKGLVIKKKTVSSFKKCHILTFYNLNKSAPLGDKGTFLHLLCYYTVMHVGTWIVAIRYQKLKIWKL